MKITMTQEEKAKAYDEAIAKSVEFYALCEKCGAKDTVDFLEGIFPELKENEDERIRKELVRAFKSLNTIKVWNGIERTEILAWLEKQAGKDKLIQELGKYKVKYTQEVLEKHINSMSNKDDERLRKTTIAFLKDFAEQGYENAVECIDWLEKQGYTKKDVDDAYLKGICNTKHELEKQGERKPTDKIEIGKKYQCIASPRYSTFRRGEIYKPVDNFLCNLMNLCSDCFEPIEDSEHNPILDFKAKDWYVSKVDGKIHNIYYSADKVEPKFKVGDWVISTLPTIKYPHLITDIQDGYYIFGEDNDHAHIASNDSILKLWTIQDAKDGDVLCTYECCEPKIVFILKGTPKKHYALSYHCYYNIMYPHFGSDSEKGCLAPKDEDVKPATKEQRDLLFQKMHEAGYTFDFKKKELRKLKFRVGDEVITENEESLTITRIDEEGYWSEDLFICGFDDAAKWELVEQNPVWSEDDEKMINKISVAIATHYSCDTAVKVENWLKSLKERIGG